MLCAESAISRFLCGDTILSMPFLHHLSLHGLHPQAATPSLLAPGSWRREAGIYHAELEASVAADLRVRLQGLVILGRALKLEIEPPLKRKTLREAQARKAKMLRESEAGFKRKAARWDEVGRYSLTPEGLAMRMAKKNPCERVLDLGCGVGGNSIAFARCGAKVSAYELDPARAELARHNCEIYGVSDRVQVHCGDALAQLPERFEGLVFCDPPWGRDWKEHPCVLERYPLARALWERRDSFGALWLKLPVAFDPRSLAPHERGKIRLQIYFGAPGSPKFLVVRYAASARAELGLG